MTTYRWIQLSSFLFVYYRYNPATRNLTVRSSATDSRRGLFVPMIDLQRALKAQDEAILRLNSPPRANSVDSVDSSPVSTSGTPSTFDVSSVNMSALSDASDAIDFRGRSPLSSIQRLRALKMSKLEEARNRTLSSSSDDSETDDSESLYSGTDFTNETEDSTYFAPLSPAGHSPAKVDRELLLSMMVKKDSKTRDGSLSSPSGSSAMQILIEEYKVKEEERRATMLQEQLKVEALKTSLDSNDDSYVGNFRNMFVSTAAAVRDGLVDPVVGSINELNKYTMEPVVGTINETAGAVRSYTVDPVVETAGTVSRYTLDPVVGSLRDSVDSVEAIVNPLYPSSLISGISSSVADWTGSAVAFPSAVYSAAVAATSAPKGKEEIPSTNDKRKSKKKDKKIITHASPLEYDDILELYKPVN